MVGYLWKAAFVQSATPGAYMRAVARRIADTSGETIDTSDCDTFLSDLARIGKLTLEETT